MADDDIDAFLKAPLVKPSAAPAAASDGDVDAFLAAPPHVEPKGEEAKPLYTGVGDIAKSAVSGAADFVPSLAGIPGSVANGASWVGDRLRTGVTNTFGRDPATWGEYFFGPKLHNSNTIDPTGKSEADVAKAVRGQAEQRWKPPGMSDMVKMAHDAGMPYHEPESGLGSAAHTAGGIIAGLAAAPLSIPAKVFGTVEGTIGTKAGEWVGEHVGKYAGDNGIGDWAGITPDDIKTGFTTVGGGLGVANGVRGNAPGLARVESDMARARAADEAHFRANPQDRPPLTMEEAAARGMHPLEAAGPNVRALVAKSAKTPEMQEHLGSYNEHVADLGNTVERLVGPLRSAGEQYAARQQGLREINNQNYQRTMALPHAQVVWTPQLEGLLKRVPDHYIQQAVQLAKLEGDTNVRPPVWQEPTPAKSSVDFTTQAMHTTEAMPGGWIADKNAPPNLAFWNYLKQAMDDDIVNQTGPLKNVDTNKIRATRGLKNEIINDHVDKLVPEFPETRGTAADLFGARDAVKQGSNLLKNIDSFTEAEVFNAIDRMPVNHHAALASGYLGDLQRMIVDDPAKAARLIKKPAFQRVMRKVVGENTANQIITAAKAQKVNPVAAEPGPMQMAIKAAHALGYVVPPALVHGASTLLPGAAGLMTVNPAIAPIAAYQVAKRYTLGKTRAYQQGVADREIVQRMTTPGGRRAFSPSDGQVLPTRPEPPMISAPDPAMNAPPLTITPRRAAGGELGAPSRGKINVDAAAGALVKQVEQARAALSGETQNILAQPDTNVVRALSVAKHALG